MADFGKYRRADNAVAGLGPVQQRGTSGNAVQGRDDSGAGTAVERPRPDPVRRGNHAHYCCQW